MAIEMEGQSSNEVQHIRTREAQRENVEKLNQVTDMVNNINIDGIETDTKEIKNVVLNNLENQTNLDDISTTLDKVVQGITDIKRSQTNINKKINELQDKVGE
jgi:hypothetical protein